MNEQKKVAIITGSATGVGAATAQQLASLGWNVVINYTRSQQEAEETVARCQQEGAETLMVQADVSEDAACQRMVAATLEKWGRIDALVNNAGMTKYCEYANLDGLQMQDFQRIYAVNVVGAFQMARAVVPYMKQAGEGTIVNTSSISALTGIGSSIAYAASKGAMNTLTLSLAQTLGPEIRVNAVCPGFIQGRWIRNGLGEERYEALRQAIESVSPLQRTATPEEVADAIVFFIVGGKIANAQLLVLDGGYHLNQRPPGL
ncbi:MAG: SDR family oxidoreductase [Bacteroidota bacterium]